MPIPRGVVCKKCDKVLGFYILDSELLTPPQIVLVCEACIAKAASETGIAPNERDVRQVPAADIPRSADLAQDFTAVRNEHSPLNDFVNGENSKCAQAARYDGYQKNVATKPVEHDEV
jgi:hypothetical protein